MKKLNNAEVKKLDKAMVMKITNTFDSVVNGHKLTEQVSERGNAYRLTTANTKKSAYYKLDNNILKIEKYHFDKRCVAYYKLV